MAIATPAATTAIPLPDYQVSGAAAAHPRGSVGPFVGVLAAVLVLTALSCFFGRLCAAHAQGPDEWYDCARLVAGASAARQAGRGGGQAAGRAAVT